MELLDILEKHWQVLGGFGIIIFSAVKFFLDMKSLQGRVNSLEAAIKLNSKGDETTKTELVEIKGTLKMLTAMIRSIAKKLDIPDLTS